MAYQDITPVRLGVQAVSATPTVDTVYTVPASTRTLLKDISICNTTAAAITIRIYLVPSGGSAGTGNALMYDVSISGNTTQQWTGVQIMEAGATIRTSASATGITVHFSGGEAV